MSYRSSKEPAYRPVLSKDGFAVRVPDLLPKWCEARRAGAFLRGRSVVKVYA